MYSRISTKSTNSYYDVITAKYNGNNREFSKVMFVIVIFLYFSLWNFNQRKTFDVKRNDKCITVTTLKYKRTRIVKHIVTRIIFSINNIHVYIIN